MASTVSDNGNYAVDDTGIMVGELGKEVQLHANSLPARKLSLNFDSHPCSDPHNQNNFSDHLEDNNYHQDDLSREHSDVSSTENSNSGIHVNEGNYSLPYMSPTHAHPAHPPHVNNSAHTPYSATMHAMNTNLYPGMNSAYKPSGAESVSLGTATQTHDAIMPMLLSTFKPATGCTNASDFIVRCFVARLRSGITVVKHGRSRWCKSRLRTLHVHPDGRSLTWKPALGEPSSSKRPPKLDLTTCREVRHAWSPDPDNPLFTGTPLLRKKCEAANAHKSFALIFPKRTVDITAVTADQCKVLMEGFSALCFRLQVAQNVAAMGQQQQVGTEGKKGGEDSEENGTASVTLTNNSVPMNSPGKLSGVGRKSR